MSLDGSQVLFIILIIIVLSFLIYFLIAKFIDISNQKEVKNSLYQIENFEIVKEEQEEQEEQEEKRPSIYVNVFCDDDKIYNLEVSSGYYVYGCNHLGFKSKKTYGDKDPIKVAEKKKEFLKEINKEIDFYLEEERNKFKNIEMIKNYD